MLDDVHLLNDFMLPLKPLTNGSRPTEIVGSAQSWRLCAESSEGIGIIMESEVIMIVFPSSSMLAGDFYSSV